MDQLATHFSRAVEEPAQQTRIEKAQKTRSSSNRRPDASFSTIHPQELSRPWGVLEEFGLSVPRLESLLLVGADRTERS